MKKFYRLKKYRAVLALTAAVSLLLSGCTAGLPLTEGDKAGQAAPELASETLGLTPDFSYERQTEKPWIKTDCLGYLPDSVKTAVFQGKKLPDRFQVITKDSGECVYEGEIRVSEGEADGLLTGYGVFTELREEGTYYIRCERIGCSYYFTIGKEVYLEKTQELANRIETACGGQAEGEKEAARESLEICRMLSYLLVTYEMYPDLLVKIWHDGDAGGGETGKNGEKFFKMLRAETDILLSTQDEKTGGVYRREKAGVTAEEGAQEAPPEINAEATAVYAGTMAKYGYLYQEYDWDYANICLKAAAKAWRYLEKEERRGTLDTDSVAAGRIYAASELYRASNERAYHNYMLQNSEFMAERGEDICLLMGKITYLSTRRAVNHELCGQIMSGLMEGAGRIAAEGRTEPFLVKEREPDAILGDMTVLALTNYAIMNHEYVTVIENHLHYLSGRNGDSALLLKDPDSVEAAKLLLLFGVVETERKIIEESMEETEK